MQHEISLLDLSFLPICGAGGVRRVDEWIMYYLSLTGLYGEINETVARKDGFLLSPSLKLDVLFKDFVITATWKWLRDGSSTIDWLIRERSREKRQAETG